VSGLVAFVSFLLLTLAHETGHALLARYCGLDVLGFDFNILHGKCWFQTPDSLFEHSLVAWGGVLAQGLLLIVFLVGYFLLLYLPQPIIDLLAPAVVVFTFANIVLIIQNLWPRPPLDGAIAWKLLPSFQNGDFKRYLQARAAARSLLRPRQQ